MVYTARYGLEFDPFIKNSKDILIESKEYKEIVFRLNYLVKTKGFGLLTGGAGQGKTTAVRHWAKSLNPSLYKVIYSSFSTLTANDFYRNMVTDLGAGPSFRKPDNFRTIQNEISRLTLEKKKTPIIIIDEASYINNAILNDFKILFNFEMDSKDRAAILLVGLPAINATLAYTAHEPLRQRITMNYHIEGLKKEEGYCYINEKVKGAGATGDIFEEAAIEAILNAADGIPRMINKLCNASLLIGNSTETSLITSDIVMQAVSDCELG